MTFRSGESYEQTNDKKTMDGLAKKSMEKGTREMTKVTRKELVDNVLRPAFENENFEDTLKEIIVRLREMYPEVAEGFMDAVKETHRKAQEK